MDFSKLSKNLGFNIDLSGDVNVIFFGNINLDGASISPYVKVSLLNLLDQKIQSLFMGMCFCLPIGVDQTEKPDLLTLTRLNRFSFYPESASRFGNLAISDLKNSQKITGVFKGRFEWNVSSLGLNDSKLEFVNFSNYVIGFRSLKEPFSSSYVRLFTPLIFEVPIEGCDYLESASNGKSRCFPTGVYLNIFPGKLKESTLEIDLFKKVQNDVVRLCKLTGKVFDPKDITFKTSLSDHLFYTDLGSFNLELQSKSKSWINGEMKSYHSLGSHGSLTSSIDFGKAIQNIAKAFENLCQTYSKQSLENALTIFTKQLSSLNELAPLNRDILEKLASIKPVIDAFVSAEDDKKLEILEQINSFVSENKAEIFSVINLHNINLKYLSFFNSADLLIQNRLQEYLAKQNEISQEDEILKNQVQEASLAFKKIHNEWLENEKYILNKESLKSLQMIMLIKKIFSKVKN